MQKPLSKQRTARRDRLDVAMRRRWQLALEAAVNRYGEDVACENADVDPKTFHDWRSTKRLPLAPMLAIACEGLGISIAFVMHNRGDIFGPTDDALPHSATGALRQTLRLEFGDLGWQIDGTPADIWRWIEQLVVREVRARAADFEPMIMLANIPGYQPGISAAYRAQRNAKREAAIIDLIELLTSRAPTLPLRPSLARAHRLIDDTRGPYKKPSAKRKP